MRSHIRCAALLLLTLSLTGCLNNSSGVKTTVKSANTGQSGANNLLVNYGTYRIAGLTVGASAINATSGLPVTVNFDLGTSTSSMLDACSSNSGPRPCLCTFSWNEINSTSGAPLTIPHNVSTPVTAVQQGLVTCTTPLNWQTEVANNTSISFTVVPGQSNPAQFNVTTYAFVKGQNVLTGNFKDNMGRSFVNILRYSCYEQRLRGMSLLNKVGTGTVTNIGSFGYVAASQFCLTNAAGQVKGGAGCTGLSPADYSTQSYYYNLYIRDSEAGDVNPGNANFICPSVTESLNQQKNGGGTPIVGTQGKYWPLDTSFALSLGKTSDYAVGVVAHTKTTSVNDPTAQNSTCDGTTTTPGTANSMISSCLGFAAKPNVDGSCPKINGVPTYRLRRYLALYPGIYDTDGKAIDESQRIDTVYIADRPVLDVGGGVLLDGKGNPYSMLGPKPCPFAYYDAYNVSGTGTNYYGTNGAVWNDKNVDNIYFPYQDTGASASGTCSALLPVVNPSLSKVSLSTVTSKRYVRPGKAWAPHYEEDTGFQACAPQSSPLRDPPLHFAMNGTNMAWCAEIYPTQNDNFNKLPRPSKNFTSHTVKNVAGGGACPLTAGSTTLHSTDFPGQNTTCDRTVVNPADGIAWAKFPLLAPEADVEASLKNDPAFNCNMTYDASNGKVDASDFGKGQSPTQGCCANVSPPAGGGAHLEPVAMPTATVTPFPVSCTPPRY